MPNYCGGEQKASEFGSVFMSMFLIVCVHGCTCMPAERTCGDIEVGELCNFPREKRGRVCTLIITKWHKIRISLEFRQRFGVPPKLKLPNKASASVR